MKLMFLLYSLYLKYGDTIVILVRVPIDIIEIKNDIKLCLSNIIII